MSDKLLTALQKRYGRVIHYESIPSYDKNKFYFFNVDIFKKPMCIFHLLRRTAIFFDKMASFTRSIIYKNTETKEKLKFFYKLK